MKKVAFYGKGGIGKSTTVSNVSVALSEMGLTVMQIGCDPKGDSTRNLMGGRIIPSVLSVMGIKGDRIALEDIVHIGSGGVYCVESGGPKPGCGCAGKGIITAFEQLEALSAYDTYKPDVVLFDVLGDVVCGGFAMPIRKGYADDIYIVTSGEMMSLYAANNIAESVRGFSKRGYASLKGLVYNSKNVEGEDELVTKASREMDIPIVIKLNRDPVVQKAENSGKSVIEYDPRSKMADQYRELAVKVMEI
ncbi:MAG: AAA family ATPase [Candidatus Methanoplasma sp.]|nr:AAA family ATPase [Candidatus Methanoplasma sp.]